MIVFVVITHYMGGYGESGVFKSKVAAQAHITSNKIGGSPKILEYSVIGEQDDPGKVFTASWYDRVLDIHNFQGVYGNYEEAKKVAGVNGLVLAREVI